MEQQMELIIESTDAEVVKEITEVFSDCNLQHGREARVVDPVTVLAIAAGTVKLINELLVLREKLRSRKGAIAVTVRNLEGDAIILAEASDEEVRSFVK